MSPEPDQLGSRDAHDEEYLAFATYGKEHAGNLALSFALRALVPLGLT